MEEWRRANGASASTFPCDVSPTNSGRPPPGYPPGYAEQQKQKQIAEKISQLELKLTMEQTQKLVLSQVVEKLMEENRGLREENGTLQRQVGRHEGIQIRENLEKRLTNVESTLQAELKEKANFEAETKRLQTELENKALEFDGAIMELERTRAENSELCEELATLRNGNSGVEFGHSNGNEEMEADTNGRCGGDGVYFPKKVFIENFAQGGGEAEVAMDSNSVLIDSRQVGDVVDDGYSLINSLLYLPTADESETDSDDDSDTDVDNKPEARSGLKSNGICGGNQIGESSRMKAKQSKQYLHLEEYTGIGIGMTGVDGKKKPKMEEEQGNGYGILNLLPLPRRRGRKPKQQNQPLIEEPRKQFACPHCERTFSKKYNLEQHQRIHTGERPFRCEQCSACFKQAIHLRDHLRIHDGEKPFKCDICPASFKQHIHLKNHMCRHTGEKPHKCLLCDQAFVQLVHLQRHISSAHDHEGKTPPISRNPPRKRKKTMAAKAEE